LSDLNPRSRSLEVKRSKSFFVQNCHRKSQEIKLFYNNSRYDYDRTADSFKDRGQRSERERERERSGHNEIDYTSLNYNVYRPASQLECTLNVLPGRRFALSEWF